MIRSLSTCVFKSTFKIRYFPNKKFCDKPQNINVKDTAAPIHNIHDISQKVHVPNKLDRIILAWTGVYKGDVPKSVPVEAVEKARNKARIKLSNYMMIATAIACFFVALSGRRAAERGESLAQTNRDWHKQYNEEAQKAEK